MRTQPVAGLAADMSLGSAILMALGAALASGAAHAAELRPNQTIPDRIVLEADSLRWQVGRRIAVQRAAETRTPDGHPAISVSISGQPSPADRYAKEYSLTTRDLRGTLPPVDPAAIVRKMVLWINPIKPTGEALIFVVRRGYGDRVPLEPAGWRQVEIHNWGLQPLTIGELDQLAIRTALLANGSQFLIGPLTCELTDPAVEAARWKSAASGPFTVNGLWWLKENGGALCRLPQRAQAIDAIDPKVRDYAHYPAGARVRFKTDSTSLALRIDHGGDPFSWKPLSLLAMAGIELYEGPPQHMVFRQISTPASGTAPYVVKFAENPERELREYTLYLPMYAKLKSLEIALDSGAKIEPPTPLAIPRPVVFYGTSFVQGGCASRASMNLPALVGRMLAVDIVNLGFAGDGRCELEMADLTAEIDAACFVMGPILNQLELMRENYPRFVGRLRQRWPERPILLMTRLHTQGQREPYEVNGLVREVWETMRAAGDRQVYLFDAFPLYRDGSVHPTVEGLHPSDLGFKMIADALAPELAKVLQLPTP